MIPVFTKVSTINLPNGEIQLYYKHASFFMYFWQMLLNLQIKQKIF